MTTEMKTIEQLKQEVYHLQVQIKTMQKQQKFEQKQLIMQDKENKKKLQKEDIDKFRAFVSLFERTKKHMHAPRKGKSFLRPTKNAILAVRRKKKTKLINT
jgi:hypothetical protein